MAASADQPQNRHNHLYLQYVTPIPAERGLLTLASTKRDECIENCRKFRGKFMRGDDMYAMCVSNCLNAYPYPEEERATWRVMSIDDKGFYGRWLGPVFGMDICAKSCTYLGTHAYLVTEGLFKGDSEVPQEVRTHWDVVPEISTINNPYYPLHYCPPSIIIEPSPPGPGDVI